MKTFHKREKRHWLVIEACFPQLNLLGCGYEQRFLYKRFIRYIVVVVVVVAVGMVAVDAVVALSVVVGVLLLCVCRYYGHFSYDL